MIFFAQYLDDHDQPGKVDAVFILSGDAVTRGDIAYQVYLKGYSKNFFCMGSNLHTVLKYYGIDTYESEVTQRALARKGIPPEMVKTVNYGTSTYEEAARIYQITKKKQFHSIMIISTAFHIRRMKFIFKKIFDEDQCNLIFYGLPDTYTHPKAWWKSENGLISIVNEYIKLFYYFIKY